MNSNELGSSQPDPLEVIRTKRGEIQLAVKTLGMRGRKCSAKFYRPTVAVREDNHVLAIAVNVLDLADIKAVLEYGPPALLLIRAQRQFNEVNKQRNVRVATNGFCKFEATIVLPSEVDERTVETCFEGSNLIIIGKKRSMSHGHRADEHQS
jgi:hypothetical protein